MLLLSKEQLFDNAYLKPLIRIIKELRNLPEFLAQFIEERSRQPDIQAKLIRKNLDVVFHHSDTSIGEFLRSSNEFQQYQSPAYWRSDDTNGEVVNTGEPATPEDAASRPITYMENLVEEVSTYYECGGKNPSIFVELSEGAHSFIVSNVGPEQTIQGGLVRLNIQGRYWNQFLCHPSVAKLIIPDASFDLLQNTMQLSVLHTLSASQSQRVSLTIPAAWDMYKAYFGSKSYEVTPSDKLYYTNGLIELAGGWEDKRAQVFRSQTAYRILDFLADKATNRLAQELMRTLNQPEVTEEALKRLILESETISQFRRKPRTFQNIKDESGSESRQCLQVLSELVRIKAVQRGLEVKCPRV